MMTSHKSVTLSQMPQLDGVRAFCLISIIIHHWTVNHFHIEFPFEIGAFIFFSLSGYLITRILLRGKSKLHEGTTSFYHLLKSFTVRRLLRLVPGYLLALTLYLLLMSPDVLANFAWYITNSTNIHFALRGSWPGGADQFWTLAVDQQFYAIWPFIILLTPRKALPIVILLFAGLAPLSRHLAYYDLTAFSGPMKDKLPWFLTDHLCLGSFLAYLQERKRMPTKKSLWIWGVTALGIYLTMRYNLLASHIPEQVYITQQTFLALTSTCIVGLCAHGFSGIGKTVLEHPLTQYIGKRSYGYYLYHNLAMLILGKVAYFLYPKSGAADTLYPVRLLCGALILAALSHLSWKFLEEPLMRRKSKHRYQSAPAK